MHGEAEIVNSQWKSLLAIDNALRAVTKCYFMASAVCISLSQTADMTNKEEHFGQTNNSKHHLAVRLEYTAVLYNCVCVFNALRQMLH